jgi:hypothetical protein
MHLDILYDRQLSVLCIVMLSKLILLFCSFYMVNCKFGLRLNSWTITFGSIKFLILIE